MFFVSYVEFSKIWPLFWRFFKRALSFCTFWPGYQKTGQPTNSTCQTWRRTIAGESVPALEKIVSIFELHTDIIRKDRPDTYYGHKICLVGGASNLILDCIVLEGNPADSELTAMMLDRQNMLYHQYPLKVALDGGF